MLAMVSIPNRDFDEFQDAIANRRGVWGSKVSIPNRDFDEFQG